VLFRVGQDVHQQAPGGRIPVAKLADEDSIPEIRI
jgi:hypothetical protein